MRVTIMAAVMGAIGFAGPAFALDKVTFGTNWVADPEAGGFYQALVDGTYAKYGLDVTILPGGPTANNGMLLIAGKIDFVMGGDMIGDFLSVAERRSHHRRRRGLPEKSASLHVASRRRPRQVGGPAQGDRVRQQRRGQYVLGVDASGLRLQGREHQAV